MRPTWQPSEVKPVLEAGFFYGLTVLSGWGDLFSIAAPGILPKPLKRRWTMSQLRHLAIALVFLEEDEELISAITVRECDDE